MSTRRKQKSLIVDTNCWASTFDEHSANSTAFKPVRDSIFEGRRTLIWGGAAYRKELQQSPTYLRLHVELAKSGRGRELLYASVESACAMVRQIANGRPINDEHLIAIEIVGRAGVIVTSDKKCHESLKDARYYKRRSPPKIYSAVSHAHLL